MAPKKTPHSANHEMAQAIHNLELKVVEGFTKLSGVMGPLTTAHKDMKEEIAKQAAQIQEMRENQIRFRQTSKYVSVFMLALIGAAASDLVGIIAKGLGQ